MWFAGGLITLLAAFAASLWVRTRAPRKGVARRTPDGVEFDYRERRKKGRLRSVLLARPVRGEFAFVVREQSAFDAWSKRVGIAVEVEVRDPRFDDALYVESDSRAFGGLLAGAPEVREAILRAFAVARRQHVPLERIRCARGRVWLELQIKGEQGLAAACDELAPVLALLAERLSSLDRSSESRRDPLVLRAATIQSISTASAALGILGTIRAVAGSTDILELPALFGLSAATGLTLLASFVFVVFVAIGRSSRTHRVLVEVLLVGGCGFTLSCFALAREADIAFDTQPAQIVEVSGVRAEHTISHSRGRTNHEYYLHVPDWRASGAGKSLRLEISARDFARLRESKAVTISVKPGALGFEWVQRIDPARP